MPQTVTEKIVQRHTVDVAQAELVSAGDIVTVRPRHVLTHDNTAAVLAKFRTIGAERVANPEQPVFALDHNVQDTSPSNLEKYRMIQEFAESQGIAFHPAGAGIGHQLMIENGFVHPGSLVVASDSHANMYGALSAVGTPVVRTDAAAIWATGSTWWQVPPTVKVVLHGKLSPGVSGKDLIMALCGTYHRGEVLNHALEFHGPGIANLSMSQRLTIANMTTEWGALVGWFPFDDVTAAYLIERAQQLARQGCSHRLDEQLIARFEDDPPLADANASYAAEITLDLAEVVPRVAGPDTVSISRSIAQLGEERIPIDKAYLLSCVNARLEDLAEAAAVLQGATVANGVELYLAAASATVQQQAQEQGIWQTIVAAGAIPLPPGCGACIGLGAGLLEPGEVGVSATNRNFKGRMGSPQAQVYLASPAVVAASAIAGYLTAGADVQNAEPSYQLRRFSHHQERPSIRILEGFPSSVEGRVVLLPVDNLNTDGIYGKDVTYREDLTPQEMASHAMANYDPEFSSLIAAGDILVSGFNFGCGSSREQAATALKHAGIQLVIAASFSQTYLRNAFNNAFICLISPQLSEAVRNARAREVQLQQKTIIAGRLRIDYQRSVAAFEGNEYPLSPMGPTAQELVLAGGLEALTRHVLR